MVKYAKWILYVYYPWIEAHGGLSMSLGRNIQNCSKELKYSSNWPGRNNFNFA